MLAIDRHQLATQVIVRRMQRHGERHVGFFRELVDLGHQARSRQGHAAARQIEAEIIQQNAQRRHDVAEIRQRFAHSHQHHVRDDAIATGLKAEFPLRQPYLTHDLRGRQVAIEALLRGRAERAVQRAADLRGNTQCAAIGLRDEHHLESLRRVCTQQPLPCAVGGALHRRNLGRADLGALGKPNAKVLRQVRHALERAFATLVHPVHQLPGAERLAADLRHKSLERRAGEAQQILETCGGLGHGGVRGNQPRGCSSVVRKKYAISCAAVAGASDPCTTFCSILRARSARIVP